MHWKHRCNSLWNWSSREADNKDWPYHTTQINVGITNLAMRCERGIPVVLWFRNFADIYHWVPPEDSYHPICRWQRKPQCAVAALYTGRDIQSSNWEKTRSGVKQNNYQHISFILNSHTYLNPQNTSQKTFAVIFRNTSILFLKSSQLEWIAQCIALKYTDPRDLHDSIIFCLESRSAGRRISKESRRP